MYYLVFDTSYNLAIGLFFNSKLIGSKILNKEDLIIKNITFSDIFLLELKDLLLNNNIEFKALSFIVVNKGPGYFTSIRISLAIAKIIKLALSIPIIGISSTFALIKEVKTPINDIVATIDIGKKGLVYAIYDEKYSLKQDHIYCEDEEISTIFSNKKYIIVGSRQDKISQALGTNHLVYQKEIFFPNLHVLAEIGLVSYNNENYDLDISPIYVKDTNIYKKQTSI
jgi:tRNA threonylcarbamoyl adenosine modification protein YeaZ